MCVCVYVCVSILCDISESPNISLCKMLTNI